MAWINLLDCIYPIGSLYFSNSSTSPASKIGGTWTAISEAVIRGSSSIGYIGSDEHEIAITEMPAHVHKQSATKGLYGQTGGNYNVFYDSTVGTDPSAARNTYETGGVSYVAGSTFLQLLYLVQNSVRPLQEVM